jgi:hypothetical protein
LIQASERLDFVIASISLNAFVEFVKRKKIHYLRKYGLATVHLPLQKVYDGIGSGKIREAKSNRKIY